MRICKNEKSYRCSNVQTIDVMGTLGINFSIIEPISPQDAVNLLEDNTFYFYDDDTQSRLTDTNDTKLVGLRIQYNADSTCNITIKLNKGDVNNES